MLKPKGFWYPYQITSCSISVNHLTIYLREKTENIEFSLLSQSTYLYLQHHVLLLSSMNKVFSLLFKAVSYNTSLDLFYSLFLRLAFETIALLSCFQFFFPFQVFFFSSYVMQIPYHFTTRQKLHENNPTVFTVWQKLLVVSKYLFPFFLNL